MKNQAILYIRSNILFLKKYRLTKKFRVHGVDYTVKESRAFSVLVCDHLLEYGDKNATIHPFLWTIHTQVTC